MIIQSYITYAAIIAFAAIIFYVVFRVNPVEEPQTEEEEDDELPEPKSVYATVKEKECGTQHMGNPYISSTFHCDNYAATFITESGEEITLDVTPEDFGSLKEGSRGLLVYLDKTFYVFDTEA